MTGHPRHSILIGIFAVAFMLVSGAGWQLLNRAGAIGGLRAFDIALFRYAIPGLILLPILLKNGLFPKGRNPWLVALMVVGGGLPFGLTIMVGVHFAPAAHLGAISPGVTPLFIAILAALVLGERFSALRLGGFAVIVVGVALVMRQAFETTWPGAWRGDLLFLLAGLLWAFYTIIVRKLGLAPWHMVAITSFWSGIGALGLWLAFGTRDFSTLPLPGLALQIIWQGAIAGLLAMYAFAISVRHLGATNTGLTGALLPGMVAIGGYLFLGEPVATLTVAGIVLISVGMVLASGALDKKREPA